MHGKPGREERGKPKDRKRERSTEEATVRRRQEEKGKETQRLSSQNPKLKRTKESENSGGQKEKRKRNGKCRKRSESGKEGKHSWNSCGSEARKGEKKQTAKLSTGTGKECTGNQAGKNGESRRNESENGALWKPL